MFIVLAKWLKVGNVRPHVQDMYVYSYVAI